MYQELIREHHTAARSVHPRPAERAPPPDGRVHRHDPFAKPWSMNAIHDIDRLSVAVLFGRAVNLTDCDINLVA
jgi:hypothetical protein